MVKKYPKTVDEIKQDLYRDYKHINPLPPGIETPPDELQDLDEYIKMQEIFISREEDLSQFRGWVSNLNEILNDTELIGEIGYRAYTDYMNSPEWRKLSRDCLARDDNECFYCGGKAIQAHHAGGYDYSRSHEEELALLKSVCWKCHEEIEQKERMENEGKQTYLRRMKNE